MCEAAVEMFAAGTPDKDTVAAIQFVESAGVEAFSTLLNHLGDKTEAAQRHLTATRPSGSPKANLICSPRGMT